MANGASGWPPGHAHSPLAFAAQLADLGISHVTGVVREVIGVHCSVQIGNGVDHSGLATRARLASRDLDLATADGRLELTAINNGLLSCAIDPGCDGRESSTRYALDHNPVTVAHALYPLLTEVARCGRLLERTLLLATAAGARARSARATVHAILRANVGYVVRWLFDGSWRDGCGEYPVPEVFLCALSELVWQFPPLFDPIGVREQLRRAVVERRSQQATSLCLALRAITARNVQMECAPELCDLVARQHRSGSWLDATAFHTPSAPGPGGELLVTAFAIRALTDEMVRPPMTNNGGWATGLLRG